MNSDEHLLKRRILILVFVGCIVMALLWYINDIMPTDAVRQERADMLNAEKHERVLRREREDMSSKEKSSFPSGEEKK